MRDAVADPSAYRHTAASAAAAGNASVIPVFNGRVLVTKEVRGGTQRYGLFGGKAEAGETLAATAAREAQEESGHVLSGVTRAAIAALEPSAFKECRAASMHVAGAHHALARLRRSLQRCAEGAQPRTGGR